MESSYTLLFDLDGTLVNTDHIYVEVWNQILQEKGLLVDNNFFEYFIRGKSDVTFVRYLIPGISDNDLELMSKRKDELFSLKLEDVNVDDILNEDVLTFVESVKDSKMAIVTSCNRTAALKILEVTGLDKFIKLTVSADDCEKHKPHPEPYCKAASMLGVQTHECIIFEDSLTGYISAIGSKPHKVFLYTGNGGFPECNKLAPSTFCTYNGLSLSSLLSDDGLSGLERYAKMLGACLRHLPVKNVVQNTEILKTGYICDINSFDVIYANQQMERVVLKMSNLDNELADVAKQLNMYEVEVYFYENIAPIIRDDVSLAKSYGTLRDGQRVGIILEDLRKYKGTFGKNLNADINMLLEIVLATQQMHSKYYFESGDNIIRPMSKLQTIGQIDYYAQLVEERFDRFYAKNLPFLSDKSAGLVTAISRNFRKILETLSVFPLSFCHGDLKSPNIFYKEDQDPVLLDWQYAHLNKGISDIAFLLVESVDFDATTATLVESYYFRLENQVRKEYTRKLHLKYLKYSLSCFPFFVMVWFNSEDNEKLLDRTFPLRFMKNLLAYYDFFLDEDTFNDDA